MQAVAYDHGVESHLLVVAVSADAAGTLRSEIQQRADGAARLLARLELEHLAQKHKDGDDRRGLEVDGHGAVHAAECGREQSGEHGGNDAVDPRHAGAHGDQREHVEIARLK